MPPRSEKGRFHLEDVYDTQRLTIPRIWPPDSPPRQGEQLWNLNGEELRNSHLSDLCFTTPVAAAELLDIALDKAMAAGFSGVFFGVPVSVWESAKGVFSGFGLSEAPAAIYGYDLPAGRDWWINTAEI